jgi:hypothetical protein
VSTALLTSLSATVLVLLASVTLGGDSRRAANGALIALGAAVLLLLLRLPLPAFGALAVAIAGYMQARRLHARRSQGRRRSRARRRSWSPASRSRMSTVRTAVLEMSLDQRSGAMTGRVLTGAHAGAQLTALSRAQLLEVAEEIDSADTQSLALMTAYLDRIHPGWSDAGTNDTGKTSMPDGGSMTREQALEVLGLSGDATVEMIHEAHRRLIKRVHPDVGGSATLTAHINAAKARLLQ